MDWSIILLTMVVTISIQLNYCVLQPLKGTDDNNIEMEIKSWRSAKTKRDVDYLRFQKSSESSNEDSALEALLGKDFVKQMNLQKECIDREKNNGLELARCLQITVSTTTTQRTTTPMRTIRTFRPTATFASNNDDSFTRTKLLQCKRTGFHSTFCTHILLSFLKAFDFELYNECKTSEMKSLACRIKVVSLIQKYENGIL